MAAVRDPVDRSLDFGGKRLSVECLPCDVDGTVNVEWLDEG